MRVSKKANGARSGSWKSSARADTTSAEFSLPSLGGLNGLIDHESDVEHLITELPTISDVEQLAEDEALRDVKSFMQIEEFDFESGEQFLTSPLVAEFLMQEWLALVPDDKRAELFNEISRLINEERHEAEFALSVKATLVVGQKAHSN